MGSRFCSVCHKPFYLDERTNQLNGQFLERSVKQGVVHRNGGIDDHFAFIGRLENGMSICISFDGASKVINGSFHYLEVAMQAFVFAHVQASYLSHNIANAPWIAFLLKLGKWYSIHLEKRASLFTSFFLSVVLNMRLGFGEVILALRRIVYTDE